MFGRKKSVDSPDEPDDPDGPMSSGRDGEPTPPSGRLRPDVSVLDELSRAFGVDSEHDDDIGVDTDDNAALIADDDELGGLLDLDVDLGRRVELDTDDDRDDDGIDDDIDDDTVPADLDPLHLTIVTAEDDGVVDTPAPSTPVDRPTIRIGDDFDDVGHIAPPEVRVTERRPTGARSTIAIGGVDDLPDAVYLDGGLDSLDDSDSGTVFIDDDGTGDAIAVKDATTPGIEPRLRQRRIGVNRAANRKRLKWVILGGTALLLVLGVLTLLGSGWFAIDDVDVAGAVYTDENRLELVVEELLGTPVLLADTEQAERDLEAIPWVEDARVSVRFPDAATIEIRERTPVATMAGVDGRFRVLDDEGRVLDVIEGQPVAFVLLAGPSTLDLAAGEFAPIGPSAAASLVTKLTPTVRPRVLSIDVTDDGADLVMYLDPGELSEQTTPIRVRFGSAIGDNEQIEKLVRLEDQLNDLPDGVITEINVATNEVTVL